MCFGNNSTPAAPQIVYQGPSQEDIDRNERSLRDFETRMAEQQSTFNDQLAAQVASNETQFNQLTQTLNDELSGYESEAAVEVNAANNAQAEADAAAGAATGAADDAAAAADAAVTDVANAETEGAAAIAGAQTEGLLQQSGAYQVATVESEPVNAQTTAAITKKKKNKQSLKIGPLGTTAVPGAGLNIGV